MNAVWPEPPKFDRRGRLIIIHQDRVSGEPGSTSTDYASWASAVPRGELTNGTRSLFNDQPEAGIAAE
jgi:hypothetical protein